MIKMLSIKIKKHGSAHYRGCYIEKYKKIIYQCGYSLRYRTDVEKNHISRRTRLKVWNPKME